jgi:hypothetical protein
MLRPPKSIDDYGGILPYLDHPDIKTVHNGYGSIDLIKNRSKGAAFLRKLFNVKATSTIYGWLERLDKERPNG